MNTQRNFDTPELNPISDQQGKNTYLVAVASGPRSRTLTGDVVIVVLINARGVIAAQIGRLTITDYHTCITAHRSITCIGFYLGTIMQITQASAWVGDEYCVCESVCVCLSARVLRRKRLEL